MTASGRQNRAILSDDLLKIADEELFVGHVLTSVAGWGPELEINLALSSMGQDEIGHAKLLFGVVVGGDRAGVNSLVYQRAPDRFRASALTSVYSQDWATLLVKQFLYETAEVERVYLLTQCGDDEVAGMAGRMRYEEEFHWDFWTTWFDRTLDTTEGPERVQAALDRLWPAGADLFALDAIAPQSRRAAEERWRAAVRERCVARGLTLPDGADQLDGDRDRILDELRAVYAATPGTW